MMISFLIFFTCYLSACVHAGGIRGALERILIRKIQLAEIAAGVALEDRVVARACNDCDFAEFIKYINKVDTVPTLPKTSGDSDSFDHMAMAKYLDSKHLTDDYAQDPDEGKRYDHIVKNAAQYRKIFELLGNRARDLKSTTSVELAHRYLEDAVIVATDVWHARREGSLKGVHKALRKKFPGVTIPTEVERYSNGNEYNRPNYDQFKATHPDLAEDIDKFIIGYRDLGSVKGHQFAIDLQSQFVGKLGAQCPDLQLPHKRQLAKTA